MLNWAMNRDYAEWNGGYIPAGGWSEQRHKGEECVVN